MVSIHITGNCYIHISNNYYLEAIKIDKNNVKAIGKRCRAHIYSANLKQAKEDILAMERIKPGVTAHGLRAELETAILVNDQFRCNEKGMWARAIQKLQKPSSDKHTELGLSTSVCATKNAIIPNKS